MGALTLPHLNTARLRLEPITQAHLELVSRLNDDPEVMAFVLGRPSTPAETEAEWSNRLATRNDAARGLGHWAGSVGGEFVGWWSASSFADDRSVAGLGYRLVRTAWGRGYATEGARAMLEQAFACPEVQRVVAHHGGAHRFACGARQAGDAAHRHLGPAAELPGRRLGAGRGRLRADP